MMKPRVIIRTVRCGAGLAVGFADGLAVGPDGAGVGAAVGAVLGSLCEKLRLKRRNIFCHRGANLPTRKVGLVSRTLYMPANVILCEISNFDYSNYKICCLLSTTTKSSLHGCLLSTPESERATTVVYSSSH